MNLSSNCKCIWRRCLLWHCCLITCGVCAAAYYYGRKNSYDQYYSGVSIRVSKAASYCGSRGYERIGMALLSLTEVLAEERLQAAIRNGVVLRLTIASNQVSDFHMVGKQLTKEFVREGGRLVIARPYPNPNAPQGYEICVHSVSKHLLLRNAASHGLEVPKD